MDRRDVLVVAGVAVAIAGADAAPWCRCGIFSKGTIRNAVTESSGMSPIRNRIVGKDKKNNRHR
eukprot:scaffold10570_cov176-Amphora_coffeaeformis.AAC.15